MQGGATVGKDVRDRDPWPSVFLTDVCNVHGHPCAHGSPCDNGHLFSQTPKYMCHLLLTYCMLTEHGECCANEEGND